MRRNLKIKTHLILTTMCVLCLVGCSYSPHEEGKSSSSVASQVCFEGTCFWFNGIEYDVVDVNENINAINDYYEIGDHIVVVGHASPKNNVYLVFDTNTKSFKKELIGSNLIWYGEDIDTIIYSFWSDIYDYEGNVIWTVSIPSTSYIDNLTFTNNYCSIEVVIQNEDGTTDIENFSIERG